MLTDDPSLNERDWRSKQIFCGGGSLKARHGMFMAAHIMRTSKHVAAVGSRRETAEADYWISRPTRTTTPQNEAVTNSTFQLIFCRTKQSTTKQTTSMVHAFNKHSLTLVIYNRIFDVD